MPRELEYVTARTGRELPGGAGVREYEGRYFMPADSLRIGAAMVPMTSEKVTSRCRHTLMILFPRATDTGMYGCA